jgi:predicted Rossmann fold flavoprotein
MPGLLEAVGHRMEKAVPSLFTFHVEEEWVRGLAGLAVPSAQVWVSGTGLKERGPVLFTHWGLSGPAILRLSAWGARELEERGYVFEVGVQWVAGRGREEWGAELQRMRRESPGKAVENTPMGGVPARLWAALVERSGGGNGVRWNQLTREAATALAGLLASTLLPVRGKSLHKDEFVTCGGVSLREVDFRTMESRVVPGLYFAGEVLDVDGITGGFNFQAAWTTGWLAARAVSASWD